MAIANAKLQIFGSEPDLIKFITTGPVTNIVWLLHTHSGKYVLIYT